MALWHTYPKSASEMASKWFELLELLNDFVWIFWRESTAKTWAKRSITNNQQAPPQIKAIFGVGFNEPRFASWRFRFADLCDKFPVGNQESKKTSRLSVAKENYWVCSTFYNEKLATNTWSTWMYLEQRELITEYRSYTVDFFMEDIINSCVYKLKWTIFAGFLFADHLSTQVSLWYFPGLQQQMGIHMTVDPSCLSHHSYSVGKEHVC